MPTRNDGVLTRSALQLLIANVASSDVEIENVATRALVEHLPVEVSIQSTSTGRITSPLGTLGMKYVDFGGMARPVSATIITSGTDVGYGRNHAAQESTS